jgi:hypothetical protein
MSNTKTVMGQASNQYVTPLDITDVFSTYLYDGTGAAQTITNGIDLAGEGGLVWLKNRVNTFGVPHILYDTNRGVEKALQSNSTNAEFTNTSGEGLQSFNSDGFSLGNNYYGENINEQPVASWTFRKAPKFFDVVTYTGDGVAGHEIAHNLGSVPGMIVVKCLTNVTFWAVYHRGVDSTAPEDFVLRFNDTSARLNTNANWNDTAPTSTNFTVGDNSWVNQSGQTYVAYLFAHNDGDGGFNGGDIIKCGSYTGTGAAGNFIDLGFEPQWVLTKRTDLSASWVLQDNMRSMSHSDYAWLYPDLSDAESSGPFSGGSAAAVPNGYVINNTGAVNNASGGNYIYIAIRRGTKVPESATEVFGIDTRSATNPSFTSNFVTDFALARDASQTWEWVVAQRLTQGTIFEGINSSAEVSSSSFNFDYQTGYGNLGSANSNYYGWMWKRAPNFFDVVAYTGVGGGTGISYSHNLGVAPEMMWVKARNSTSDWIVYHKGADATSPQDKFLNLNDTGSVGDALYWWDTAPTDIQFTVGPYTETSSSGVNYIAYLFATLPGISKVGSYTGDGTTDGSKIIDCGFTSGARFVMIKAYNTGGDWMVYDTTRGIVVGNDPILSLNDTVAEATTYDNLIPNSSGFAVIQNTDGAYTTNESGHSYIFYAIA